MNRSASVGVWYPVPYTKGLWRSLIYLYICQWVDRPWYKLKNQQEPANLSRPLSAAAGENL